MNERVAIYGGWNLPPAVREAVRQRVLAMKPGDTLVITDEPGAAYEAKAASRDLSRHHLNVIEIPADWSAHGTEAIREQTHRIYQAADRAVVYWDGHNPRVRDFINWGSEIPCEVIRYVGEGVLG